MVYCPQLFVDTGRWFLLVAVFIMKKFQIYLQIILWMARMIAPSPMMEHFKPSVSPLGSDNSQTLHPYSQNVKWPNSVIEMNDRNWESAQFEKNLKNLDKGFYTNNASPNPPKRKIWKLGQGYSDLVQDKQKKYFGPVATAHVQQYMSSEARAPESQHSSTKFEHIWVRWFYGALAVGGISTVASSFTWKKCVACHKPEKILPLDSNPPPA